MIHSVMTSAFALSVLLVASSVLAIFAVFGLAGSIRKLGEKMGFYEQMKKLIERGNQTSQEIKAVVLSCSAPEHGRLLDTATRSARSLRVEELVVRVSPESTTRIEWSNE